MSRETKTIDYMPPYMAELKQMQEIYKAYEEEKLNGYNIKDTSLGEVFVLTCKTFGLEEYEKMLNIKSDIRDTVEDRRLRVLTVLMGDIPYTFESVYNSLKLLCGEDNVNMEYAKEIYTLRVIIRLKAKSQFNTVYTMLKKLLPCNISLICLLAYNRHSTLRACTHKYLGGYSHRALREESLGG